MPRGGVHTSPQERQQVRQSYYATSEKEAGLAHLWHLQQLADIRLNPDHSIRDVPGVNFQRPQDSADGYRELFAQRYAQQVQHDEAKVYAQNKVIYRNLVLASDDEARAARNMNLVPTPAQVQRFDNIDQQTRHRTQDRQRRQRAVAEENERLLGHLLRVPPHVQQAKELDAWYQKVHKKRLAQLSRFKPAERYAGERLLEGTAAFAAASRRARQQGSGSSGAGAAMPTLAQSAPPLLRGQPYPPPSIAVSVRHAPSALRPSATATSYNGVSLSGQEEEEGSTGGGSRAQQQQQQRRRRPEWQPLAATDIPLLHYAADQQLRGRAGRQNTPHGQSVRREKDASCGKTRSEADAANARSPSPRLPGAAAASSHSSNNGGGAEKASGERQGKLHEFNAPSPPRHSPSAQHPTRRITAQEEGGVTQLWRRAVEGRSGGGGGGGGGRTTTPPRPPAKKASTTHTNAEPVRGGHAAIAAADADLPPAADRSGVGSGVVQQRRVDGAVSGVAGRSAGGRVESEDAALRQLMEGWSRRSEASAATYAPV